MTGKTVLITGATGGIGKQTAYDLAGLGANTWIHERNFECKKKGDMPLFIGLFFNQYFK